MTKRWLLIILGIVILFYYTVFDLFTTIYYCDAAVRDMPISLRGALRFDLRGFKKIINVRGLLIVIYLALMLEKLAKRTDFERILDALLRRIS